MYATNFGGRCHESCRRNFAMTKQIYKILTWLLILIFAYSQVHQWVYERNTSIWGFICLLTLGLAFAISFLRFFFSREYITRNIFSNLTVLVSSFPVALLLAELMLRWFSTGLESYGERNGSPVYHSSYDVYIQQFENGSGSFFVNQPSGTEMFNKSEFQYLHKYNSLGLRDREFKTDKDSNEFRILGLGDSFTEGVGTSEDSTWLRQLEYMLNHTSQKTRYTTMNGGAHGSDLFFSYELFDRCLLKYKPQLVILNLNSTDINDCIYRGCGERFDAQGHFHCKKGPWWEFFFGCSYIVRLIVLNFLHYDWQLLSPAAQKNEEEIVLTEIGKKINDYLTLTKKNKITFLLVLQPLQEDIRDRTDPLQRLKFDTSIHYIRLDSYLSDSIHAYHDDFSLFYWPKDGHFTTRGYAIEANAIFKDYFAGQHIDSCQKK